MAVTLVILGLVFQILIPGWLIARLSGRKVSLSDGFATGILAVIFVTLAAALVFANIEAISIAARGLLLTVSVLAVWRLLRAGGSVSQEAQAFVRAIKEFPWLLSLVIVVATALFILSHNLGFDDIAHLYYLSKIKGEVLFPVFIEVREGWFVGRYPLFGLTIGVLSKGILGGGFYTYYFIGLATLIFLLAKIYDVVKARSGSIRTASAFYLLAATILIAGSFDNYLNFGLYPLQQAKLLFLLGSVFLIVFLFDRQHILSLVLSGGLLASSLAYHFNLLLFAPVVIIAGMCVLIIERKRARSLKALALILVIPLMIGTLALRPESGFVRFEEPVREAVEQIEVVKPPKPSALELVWARLKSIAKWVSDGHYRDFYIARVYSLEMLLIPVLVLGGSYLRIIPALYPAGLVLFLISFGVHAGARLPAQWASAILQGGPWLIATDFLRSGINVNGSKSSIFYTDAYTALVLNRLGVSNVVGVDSKIANQIFSPLISAPSLDFKNSLDSGARGRDIRFLVNSRYWGMGVLKKYGVLGELPSLELDNDINGVFSDAQSRKLDRILASLLPIAKSQIAMPMIELTRESVEDAVSRSTSVGPNNQPRVAVYRDSALIKLPGLKSGEVAELHVDGVGDFFEVMTRAQGERSFKALTRLSGDQEVGGLFEADFALIHVDHQERVITVEATQPLRDLELFLTLDTGHLAGLGEIWHIDIK